MFPEYVASYSIVKGSILGPGGKNIEDSSYDGIEIDSLLINGLGQLTDGILGEISEILTSSTNGTNWVGWSDRTTVQIIFSFQELREFENCSVHVARIPELEIEVRHFFCLLYMYILIHFLKFLISNFFRHFR